MDWNGLQVLLAIERGGSARAAAERLRCSHSTVLRRLETFEQTLDVQLFERTPEGFVLSAAGDKILPKAQQIEAEMLELNRLISGSDVRLQGPIRLTVPPPLAHSLILPNLLSFKSEFPLIDIEIVSTYEYSDLSRRDADIAIRFTDKPDDHLVGRRLPPFHDAIYASAEYIETHWSENGNDSEWIAWSGRSGFKSRIAKSPYAANNIAWDFPSLSLQTHAARLGLGMAFLPCLVGDPSSDLVRVPESGLYVGRTAWLLTHPDLRRMERVKVFSDFLYKVIQSQSGLIAGDRK